MYHDSTLYIHKDILLRIDNVAALNGYKRNQVIILFFKYAMNDYKSLVKNNVAISYQLPDEDDLWNIIHVWYSEDIYCFANMMRFLYRMSMSLILAESVRKHFFKILKKLNVFEPGNTDNYLFEKYEFSYEVTDLKIFWKKNWVKQIKKE